MSEPDLTIARTIRNNMNNVVDLLNSAVETNVRMMTELGNQVRRVVGMRC